MKTPQFIYAWRLGTVVVTVLVVLLAVLGLVGIGPLAGLPHLGA